jgi:NAD(P)-dependent dehydrogenase (short-subunit alcohol dehydrogenase family)
MTTLTLQQYPSQFSPVYSASKAGVVNFARSIAYSFFANDGIRVYATCPGTVRTNLLNSNEWTAFPDEFFTPVEKIASTVVMLLEGGDMEDSNGRKIPAAKAYGLAAEINGTRHYFRDPVDFCDDNMRQVMEATSMENQEKYMRKESVTA